MSKQRSKFYRYLSLLLLCASMSHCYNRPQASTTNGLMGGGLPLAAKIRQSYGDCTRTSPSGARRCMIQAFTTSLTQAGLRDPGRSNADTRTMANDLNHRRFVVAQACEAPGDLEETFPKECKALTGGGDLPSLVQTLNVIGGYTDGEGVGYGGKPVFFEYLLAMGVAVAVYDKSDIPWTGSVGPRMSSPRKPVEKTPVLLTREEKTAIEQRYGSGKRFPLQLMSLDYVAQHSFESMKNVQAKYRWVDCGMRSVGIAACGDPQTLYESAQRKVELKGGPYQLDSHDLNFSINSVLAAENNSFLRTAHHWPCVGNRNSTMETGVATNLVEELGVGTYIALAITINGGGGHATVASVHHDQAEGYRIYTHDFQYFLQYEGLPRMSMDLGSNPRTDIYYHFKKVSMDPLPIDPKARGVVAGALKAISDRLFKSGGQ